MSAGLVAFLASLGVATWVYTKLRNRTGAGNNQSAYIGAAVVFVICFVVIFTIGHSLLKS